ncbi:synaptonemal complex protein 3-like [Uloborus diversus]|uniref:synaptonemal complex protein 3-like n=1 Tax=Uloborus diversus TaxID=327109 RepID=UPI002408F97B|nr:synaptonemal complex protein 3-like [Uloborus diversus]
MLEKFGNEVNKTMQVKKKKMEQFTQETMRMTVNKIFEVSKKQYLEREKVIEQFRNQFFSMIHEAETEVAKAKEAEAKFQKFMTQNQKQQQQFRSSQVLRLQSLKNMSEEFSKGMNALEENHIQSFASVHDELRKDMALMLKKMMGETQQQEMSNIRNQLKHIL